MDSKFFFDKVDTLYLPPTKSSNGDCKSSNDMKYIYHVKNHIFKKPVIVMSDIHSHTQAVIDYLDENYDLSQFTIITVGDMAGKFIYGVDDDPTPYYKQFLEKGNEFYFVQGNHDLPDEIGECTRLKNTNSYNCMVHGNVLNTDIGKIGGVNGIITLKKKKHPYKYTREEYLKYLSHYNKNKIDILLTHETPKHSDDVIGDEDLWNFIRKLKPKMYFYGHCHHKSPYYFKENIHLFNVDSRVLIFL